MTVRDCPDCGALAVLFADYELNDLNALGLRCSDQCGWQETMQDLLDKIETIEDWMPSEDETPVTVHLKRPREGEQKYRLTYEPDLPIETVMHAAAFLVFQIGRDSAHGMEQTTDNILSFATKMRSSNDNRPYKEDEGNPDDR